MSTVVFQKFTLFPQIKLLLAMIDNLHIVAFRIQYKRSIIIRMVVRTNSRGTIVLATRLESLVVELIDLGTS